MTARVDSAMTIEIKWTDTDPETGQRRYLCAEKWAGEWSFKWKLQRRGNWTKGLAPTRAMWEHVLDSLKRSFQTRLYRVDAAPARIESLKDLQPNAPSTRA